MRVSIFYLDALSVDAEALLPSRLDESQHKMQGTELLRGTLLCKMEPLQLSRMTVLVDSRDLGPSPAHERWGTGCLVIMHLVEKGPPHESQLKSLHCMLCSRPRSAQEAQKSHYLGAWMLSACLIK